MDVTVMQDTRPGKFDQMQLMLEDFERCIQLTGTQCKVPLHPIIVTAPLELLHIHYMSIEMTVELNNPPKVINVKVFQDHFMKHIMAYVTPNQTAKTTAKFPYQGYISIFGALAKLLSDQWANFMSNIICELCKLMGIKKFNTSPYHAQTNGQVECANQSIMQITGKLCEDQKADRPNHLLGDDASLQL